MKQISLYHAVAAIPLFAVVPAVSGAGFLEDSSLTLTARNYYIDRDFKGDSRYSAAREWAQGFILKAQSGYTEGPIGFGIDLTGSLGIKLDSSPNRAGTGLLPVSPVSRETPSEYSELAGALKARISKTHLQLGALYPTLPIIWASPARLIPQYYRGVYATSEEFTNLKIHAGWLDRVNQRDSTDFQAITLANPNSRYRAGATSEQYVLGGLEYAVTPSVTAKLFHAELKDIFIQDHLGILHTTALGPGTLKSDLRYFNSRESGSAKAGVIDNQNYGAMFSYQLTAHTASIGYMHQSGDTGLPYLGGGEGGVLSEGAMSADFVNPKENTLVLRYDYDFAGIGVPGLRGMLRYMRGTNIELPALGGSDLKESSKDVEMSYVIQSGPARGLALRLRHAIYRNDLSAAATFRSDNETRVNVDYTWKFR